jgi:S-adenosylmethionine:tRNA ribosyltransferase-isomerase
LGDDVPGGRIDEFDFHLPAGCIAQHPAQPRDAARLLHVSESSSNHVVSDFPALLQPGDVLVANDTRVIPAQLEGRRGAAHIGITLDRPAADGTWHGLARNARRLHAGDLLTFAGGLSAHVESVAGGDVRLRFNCDGPEFDAALQTAGAIALPPYIARPDGPSARDRADYQTIFARHDGAVAAPTAGLHFTPALLDALAARGVGLVHITLHVGAGTFLPVRTDDPTHHTMHAERCYISAEAVKRISAARDAGGRVVAVGTTSLRALEAAASTGDLRPYAGETDLFIRPGYRFRIVDRLLTNFHLPRSTLFMLVCAFAGTARMRAAYVQAIESGYRFYSYGDACLLDRAA